MDPYNETSKTWNKIAALYAEKFMTLALYNDSYDRFCSLVSAEKPNILEIGCGPGNISKYLLAKRPEMQLVGIDNAPNMIQLAKEYNPNASFLVMDARDIDSISTKFNGVICGFCLPYLSKEDATVLIRNSYMLLSHDGIFYLSFVEGDHSASGFQRGSTGDATYFYYYEPNFVVGKLIAMNFELLERLEYKYTRNDGTLENHIVLIAKKGQIS
jgi:SAM-dependent methyltransferase